LYNSSRKIKFINLYKFFVIIISVFLARDEQLGLQAVQQLQLSNPNASKKVNFHQLDITSVESIHHLADFIKKAHGGLDILINNAAIAFKVIENKKKTFFFLIKLKILCF
jgi:NAD(P)-dependent dehydrogenase (short-subunit alcohol dehydrogenase family)